MSTEKTGNIPPEKVVSLSDSWNAAKERTDNVIGQRLAAERKRRGLTLESLREQLQICGVDIQIQGLSKWEKVSQYQMPINSSLSAVFWESKITWSAGSWRS